MRTGMIFLHILIVNSLAIPIGAQPVSNFTAASSLCLSETLQIDNNSSAATRYTWDFCNSDLQDPTPLISTVTSLPTSGSFFYNSLKLIHYNGGFVGFATDPPGANLIHINFGSD